VCTHATTRTHQSWAPVAVATDRVVATLEDVDHRINAPDRAPRDRRREAAKE
jgi:hypothetical protein